LRFTFVTAAYRPSTPHSSGFARLASGAFYAAIALTTFYEIINKRGRKRHDSVDFRADSGRMAIALCPLLLLPFEFVKLLKTLEKT